MGAMRVRKKSRFNSGSDSSIGWDAALKYGIGKVKGRARRRRKTWTKIENRNKVYHQLDALRQKHDEGTDWEFVKHLLDTKQASSLQQAKQMEKVWR